MELKLNINSIIKSTSKKEINESQYYVYSDSILSDSHDLYRYFRHFHEIVNPLQPKIVYISGQLADNDLFDVPINIIIVIDALSDSSLYSLEFLLCKDSYLLPDNYEYYNNVFNAFVNDIKFEDIKILDITNIYECYSNQINYLNLESSHHVYINEMLDAKLSEESILYLRRLNDKESGLLIHGVYCCNSIKNLSDNYKIFITIHPEIDILSFYFNDKVDRRSINLTSIDIINCINNLTK